VLSRLAGYYCLEKRDAVERERDVAATRPEDYGVDSARSRRETARLLANGHRALQERFGVSVTILIAVERGQVVQRLRDVRMIGTDRFLSQGQRPLEQRLGFGVTTLLAVDEPARADCLVINTPTAKKPVRTYGKHMMRCAGQPVIKTPAT
jgi:hypothetical protein